MVRQHVEHFLSLVSEINDRDIVDIADLFIRSKKILIAGNGGSYANATHIAGDLSANTKLTALIRGVGDNLVSFSALSNDFSYVDAMTMDAKRWLDEGTALVLLSTSGRSPNIIQLGRHGKHLGAKIVAITGMTPDVELAYMADHHMKFSSQDAGIIESVYDLVGHLLVKQVNEILGDPKAC